jgi:hypothetical protein
MPTTNTGYHPLDEVTKERRLPSRVALLEKMLFGPELDALKARILVPESKIYVGPGFTVPYNGNWRRYQGDLTNWEGAWFYRSGGRVYLGGMVDLPTANVGTWNTQSIFTLPEGYRPPKFCTWPVAVYSNNGAGMARVQVSAAGAVLLQDWSPTTTAPSTSLAFASLEGGSFRHA